MGPSIFQIYYEVKVTEHLPADFGDDHQETNPHVLRIGWSIDNSSFQLGMCRHLELSMYVFVKYSWFVEKREIYSLQ